MPVKVAAARPSLRLRLSGTLTGGSGGACRPQRPDSYPAIPAGCTVSSGDDVRISVDASGVVQISHSDAWWCRDCGRLRVLDCWDRCEPCAAADRAEARRIAQLAAGELQ